MRLVTERLILRDITMKDAKELVRHLDNLDISKWLPKKKFIEQIDWWGGKERLKKILR